MRTTYLLFVAALLTCPLFSADALPNFVLIFVDDQGYQDLGCYGSPNIATPHLDRLAQEGCRFTDFYALAPVCSASRAALMTGCYPPRVGITGVLFPKHRKGLHDREVTIAETLRERGYATAAIGKWHLGHLPQFLPTNHGFDSYFGIPYSNDMDKIKENSLGKGVDGLDEAYRANDVRAWNVPLLRNTKIIERPAQQTTLTKRYTEEAIRFIEDHREQRFFLYLAHTMPHIPLFASESFKGRSAAGPYGDVIEEIDDSVGQILDALKRSGLDENTLVVYTSDNGPWLSMKHHGGSAKPLRSGKFSTYEGGMRVPAIMRWPERIPAGTVSREVAATFDLYPTFAALAGASLPTDRVIDGRDLSELFEPRPDSRRLPRDFHYYKGGKIEAMRSGRWKVRLRRPAKKKDAERKPRFELFDLQKDIGEQQNLAAKHPRRVKRLWERAQAFDRRLQAFKRPAGTVPEEK